MSFEPVTVEVGDDGLLTVNGLPAGVISPEEREMLARALPDPGEAREMLSALKARLDEAAP